MENDRENDGPLLISYEKPCKGGLQRRGVSLQGSLLKALKGNA